jgi:hypothetical protein
MTQIQQALRHPQQRCQQAPWQLQTGGVAPQGTPPQKPPQGHTLPCLQAAHAPTVAGVNRNRAHQATLHHPRHRRHHRRRVVRHAASAGTTGAVQPRTTANCLRAAAANSLCAAAANSVWAAATSGIDGPGREHKTHGAAPLVCRRPEHVQERGPPQACRVYGHHGLAHGDRGARGEDRPARGAGSRDGATAATTPAAAAAAASDGGCVGHDAHAVLQQGRAQ